MVHKPSVHFLCTSFFDLLPTTQEAKEDTKGESKGESKSDCSLLSFDFIYDYTFFCALHPSLHTEWAKQMFDLLSPNGQLCTLIYPIMSREGGPPYEVSMELYQTLLLPLGFIEERLDILPDEMCHPGRGEGKCALGIWRKPETVTVA